MDRNYERMTRTVYTLDQVEQAVKLQPGTTSVHIFTGFVDPDSNAKVTKVTTWKPGEHLEAQTGFFRSSTFGNFTAVLKPGNEVLYFSNQGADESGQPIQGVQMPQEITGINIQDLINRAIEREQMIAELEAELATARETIQELESTERKFENALMKLASAFVKWPDGAKGGPLQGTRNKVQTAPKNTDVMAEELTDLENALAVLVNAFGEDWLINFAAKCQASPEIVPQIKSYFS